MRYIAGGGQIQAPVGEQSPEHRAQPAQEVLDEDKVIERLPIDLEKENIKIVPVDRVFR